MEIKKLKIGSLVSTRNYAEDVEALSGPIAQLGERLNGIQQVAGSIPVGSTEGFSSCFMAELELVHKKTKAIRKH